MSFGRRQAAPNGKAEAQKLPDLDRRAARHSRRREGFATFSQHILNHRLAWAQLRHQLLQPAVFVLRLLHLVHLILLPGQHTASWGICSLIRVLVAISALALTADSGIDLE